MPPSQLDAPVNSPVPEHVCEYIKLYDYCYGVLRSYSYYNTLVDFMNYLLIHQITLASHR